MACLHGAELGAAHGAKVSGLCWLLGQRGVVEQSSCHGVQGKVELVIPATPATLRLNAFGDMSTLGQGTSLALLMLRLTVLYKATVCLLNCLEERVTGTLNLL